MFILTSVFVLGATVICTPLSEFELLRDHVEDTCYGGCNLVYQVNSATSDTYLSVI